MKKFLAIICLMTLCSCTFENQYGKCIGVSEEGNPRLTYSIDGWNMIWTVVFFEAVFPPILWVIKCARCPDGVKEQSK